MATPGASDLGQYFDFGEAAIPDEHHAQNTAAVQSGEGFLTQEELQNITNAELDFNTDFSTHLPRYQKPTHSCDYCRSKGLECFIYDADGSGPVRCSPCNALFRPCSFSDLEKSSALRQRGALDTLDVVGEDDERCFGGLTGKKQMRSLGHMGPIEDDTPGDERPKKGAAAARFSQAAVRTLKQWMLQHIDHPYPTEEDKELLAQQTGLNMGQVSNWMANTRRRQKARPKRSASPSIRPSTEAINIPAGRTWESLSTLERWKYSPPENEPAPMTAIAHAVETFAPPASVGTSIGHRKDISNDSTGSFSLFRAPSISSLETGLTGMSSGSLGSHNSAYSHGSRHSLGSMSSLKSKERRRRRRLPVRAPKADANEGSRPFQCTFCTDRFKSKYDWSRHEKSLHLSLEKWICAPLGEVIVDKVTGKRKCVYCDELEPSTEHLSTHNHSCCEEKGVESRTFYRKDHLRQHLRLMHGCKMTASMELWKSETQYIKSRCGFCEMTFNKWQDRVDHLAKEFRGGADMKTWKGCRGLDAHVAIHVTNAMPPYLIAVESKSPFPFSASNSSSIKQSHLQLERGDMEYLLPSNLEHSPTNDLFVAYQDNRDVNRIGPILLTTQKAYSASESTQINPNATCWEILTLRLGRYVREDIEKNGTSSMTDQMLQREARVILYGDPDGWEQTAADNPEWLSLFKKAHGIDSTQNVAGVTSQHEIYEDLGLNANSVLDSSFNINNVRCLDLADADHGPQLAYECALTGKVRFLPMAHQSFSGRQSPQSIPGLSGSVSASPKSLASQALALSSAQPSTHWPGEQASPIASLNAQSTVAGESVYECANVGLRSFSPLDQQACPADDPFSISALQDRASKNSNPVPETDDFQFPTWDQLPVDFQNPTTSAEFCSTIPISTTGLSTPNVQSSAGDLLAWDNEDMDFAMDLDVDMDLGFDAFGSL